MNQLKIYFAYFVLCGFCISCVYKTDVGIIDGSKYFYINNSDYPVIISTPSPSQDPFMADAVIIDSTIAIGDTIRYHNKTPEGLYCPFGCYDNNLVVKLTFNAPVKKCLAFAGVISDDSKDGDIRSSASYSVVPKGNGISELFFSINNVHYQKGTSCE